MSPILNLSRSSHFIIRMWSTTQASLRLLLLHLLLYLLQSNRPLTLSLLMRRCNQFIKVHRSSHRLRTLLNHPLHSRTIKHPQHIFHRNNSRLQRVRLWFVIIPWLIPRRLLLCPRCTWRGATLFHLHFLSLIVHPNKPFRTCQLLLWFLLCLLHQLPCPSSLAFRHLCHSQLTRSIIRHCRQGSSRRKKGKRHC